MAQAGSILSLLVGVSLFGAATRVAFPPAAWIGLAALVHASRSMRRPRIHLSLVGVVRLAWDRQARHISGGHLGHYVRRRLVCIDVRIGVEPQFQLD